MSFFIDLSRKGREKDLAPFSSFEHASRRQDDEKGFWYEANAEKWHR
jgi:hypothetical protein